MLTLDYRQFERAMRFQMQVTPRTCEDILTWAGGTLIVGSSTVDGAIQRTPKAEASKVNAVPDAKIAMAIRKKAKKKGRKMSRADMKKAVAKERRRRKQSRAYTAGPGWHKAAVAMGKRGVRIQGGFSKSEAAHGSGKKPTAKSLVAEIVNTAPAIEKIGREALQAALDDTASDMTAYATKKLNEQFAKSNA